MDAIDDRVTIDSNRIILSQLGEEMNIELVKLTDEYREQLFDMLTEWKNDIIVHHTDMSPWKIWANDFHDFDSYLNNLDTRKRVKVTGFLIQHYFVLIKIGIFL